MSGLVGRNESFHYLDTKHLSIGNFGSLRMVNEFCLRLRTLNGQVGTRLVKIQDSQGGGGKICNTMMETSIQVQN